jgi:predicted Zn-dependent protease
VLGAAAAVTSGKPEAAAAVITGGQTGIIRNILAFTRANEQAADQAALNTLDKLGISASGMLKTFELLRRNERQRGGNPDPYMITHPLSSERIEHVRNHIKNSKIPEGQYPAKFKEKHERMIAKLFAFLNSPERTMQRYPASNKSVAAQMARAIAYHKMPDIERALAAMRDLQEQLPDDAYLYDLKGQILFENNRAREALTAYQRAAELEPDSPLILLSLAQTEIALELPSLLKSAIAHLEKASRLETANSTIWRQLAIAYGKNGDNALSALALAEEALLTGDAGMAIQQADIAIRSTRENSPPNLRARDIKNHALEMKKAQDEAQEAF